MTSTPAATARRAPAEPARSGRGHLHPRAGQAVRRVRRRRRAGPRHPARRDLRAARPQRRRQDDDGRDLRGLPRPRRRRGPRARARTRPHGKPAWKARLGIVLQSGLRREPADRAARCCGPGLLLPRPARPRRGARAGRADREGRRPRARPCPAASGAGSTSRSASSAGPTLLFLDEPTTGFDPEARRQFWSLIRSLRELGTTILLTTHYLDEAEALADRVGVIARGRLVEVAVPSVLGGRETAPAVVSWTEDGVRRTAETATPTRVRARAGRAVPRRGARPGRRPADPRGRLPADDRRALVTTDPAARPAVAAAGVPVAGRRSSSRSSSASARPSSSP